MLQARLAVAQMDRALHLVPGLRSGTAPLQ